MTLETHLYRFNAQYGQSTALIFAAKNGLNETAEKALGAHADIETRLDGVTPLGFAVQGNHPKMMELLLKRGCSIGADDRIAVNHSTCGICKPPARQRSLTEGFLALAIRHNFLDVANILLRYDLYKKDETRTFPCSSPLLVAVKEDNEAMIRLLASHGVNLEAPLICVEYTALSWAAYFRPSTSFKTLLDCGAKIYIGDAEWSNPLTEAVRSGNTEIFNLVLNHPDLDINHQTGAHAKTGRTALWQAFQNGRSELIDPLLEKGADPNMPGNTITPFPPVYLAVRSRWEAALRSLLAKNANPNVSVGRITPLFKAVQGKDETMVELLLKYGAEPNVPFLYWEHEIDDWSPLTPLGLAMRDKRYDMAMLLLRYGADINCRGWKGHTMLVQAIPRMGLQNIEIMLGCGANPNIRTDNNLFPLFLAVMRQDIELAKMLIKYGADPNDKMNGISLLSWATRNNDLEMKNLLYQHGALDT
ncbi:hypothetical protein N7456_002513 [Penicillium angulare]|uniref:Uncharacterized protein n=1 Tax=Penicillium angulare TaxID=116970 RepID=A0A9W9G882_9EURO|nr:hypothetical protein N7456_002513 [Penicillium angulare]